MESRIEIRPGRVINILVHHHPSSKATAFLIHGMGGRSDQWHEQINSLKNRYTLVIPDLLGHGKSDKPKPGTSNPYSFPEFDQDLQALFKQFSTDENIIIGHSYGGALATSLAIDHQDNVSHLLLIAPTPCIPTLHIPSIFKLPAFVLEWLRPLFEHNFAQLAFSHSTNPALITEEIKAGKQNPMYMIKSVLTGIKHMPAIDVTMLTVPTLILLGERDGIVPSVISHQFYNTAPRHQFDVIENTAHMIMLENPKATNIAITDFLDKGLSMITP